MRATGTRGIYERLGVKPVINAQGNMTLLGGSILATDVQDAMAEANECFVEMQELLAKSGQLVAGTLGAEAALVTSGCFAALVLGAAAIMAGQDPAKIAQLPDTTGLKNEFLIQQPMRYSYDRSVGVAGARLIEVGDRSGFSGRRPAGQLEAAITPRTAGLLYLAQAEGRPGTIALADAVAIARRRGIAVLVDAAAEVYPLDRMTGVVQSGADLVCFGAKYFGSPHSAGLLCGRKELIDAAVRHNFIGFETEANRSLGRGYKVDRQEVVATVVALQRWFEMDHTARLALQERRIQVIAEALAGLPHVQTESTWPRQGPWKRLRVTLDEAALGRSAVAVAQAARAGDPSIWVGAEGDQLSLSVHTLREGEDRIVGERLRQLLTEAGTAMARGL
jgi:D-glucosaminate-6-phosphate ammonia-lyase